jgi:hypothetical protein
MDAKETLTAVVADGITYAIKPDSSSPEATLNEVTWSDWTKAILTDGRTVIFNNKKVSALIFGRTNYSQLPSADPALGLE